MSEEKKATGYKCTNCGRIGHISGFRCLRCKNSEFEEIELGEECELLTYTRISNPLSGVDGGPPLLVGILEFPNGVQVIGQICVDSAESLKTGEKFEPIWGKIREIKGEKTSGLKFKPI